ncbi:MAG: hypothetical protein H0T76_11215 [Nannocystis sp.]|nr:hypothetical protein [Nannocystis sp.]MBA3547043.1 hypothetical protein [Nannocystis sp.]
MLHPDRASPAKILCLPPPRLHLRLISDATGKTLEVDIHRALEQVVVAITAITGTSDVIDPRALVRHWMSQLDTTTRANFLMEVLSEGWQRHLGAIARAVLAGKSSWSTEPAEPAPEPSPDVPEPAV